MDVFSPGELVDGYLDTDWISFDPQSGNGLVVIAIKRFDLSRRLKSAPWKIVRRVPLVRVDLRIAGVESLELDGPSESEPWMIDTVEWETPNEMAIAAGAITATFRGESLRPDMVVTSDVLGECELTSRFDIYESENIIDLSTPTV